MQSSSARSSETLSAVECYHVLRDQVEHEDSLTTQRLSWLLAAQSFLFTAYAIVLNGPAEVQNQFVATQRSWLLTALPALGFSSAVLIYISILAGVVALFGLPARPGSLRILCRRRQLSSRARDTLHANYWAGVAAPRPADFCRRLALSHAPRFGSVGIAASATLSLANGFISIAGKFYGNIANRHDRSRPDGREHGAAAVARGASMHRL